MHHSVLVTGATGLVGRAVVEKLSQASVSVIALAHSQSEKSADRLFADFPNVSIKEVNFSKPDTLQEVFSNTNRIFIVLPDSPNMPDQCRNILEAAAEKGVRHVVFLSGGGVVVAPQLPTSQWLGACETIVKESGIEYTILRSTFFMQNFVRYFPPQPDGVLYLPWGDARITLADVRDIGSAAVVAFQDLRCRNQTYTIGSNRSLSGKDIADRIANATGKSVVYRDIPDEAALQAMKTAGLPDQMAHMIIELHRSVKNGSQQIQTKDFETLTGHEPTPFEVFATDYKTSLLSVMS